jgi:hypothetical protein
MSAPFFDLDDFSRCVARSQRAIVSWRDVPNIIDGPTVGPKESIFPGDVIRDFAPIQLPGSSILTGSAIGEFVSLVFSAKEAT